MDNEKEIKRYMFDPVQSVSTILNAIIGYKDLCELLVEVIKDIAMVKIGYAIMNRAKCFKYFLNKWSDKVDVNKTWNVLQKHFRRAYKDLKHMNALGVQDSQVKRLEWFKKSKHIRLDDERVD